MFIIITTYTGLLYELTSRNYAYSNSLDNKQS